MKNRSCVTVLILVLGVLIIIGNCATTKKAISKEDFYEVFNDTWINTDYTGFEPRFQKRVHYPNRDWEVYSELSSAKPFYVFNGVIIDQWMDSKGTIWYETQWEVKGSWKAKAYEMGKISNSGNTLEILMSYGEKPIKAWEPDNIRYIYLIYYRQE
jgi:hypothetical protein